jgi:hypothetical protein
LNVPSVFRRPDDRGVGPARDGPNPANCRNIGGFSLSHNDSIDKNTMGWSVAITKNFNNWFGLSVGGGGGYETAQESGIDFDLSGHSISAGPRFSFRRNPRVVPFAEIALGVNHARASALGSTVSSNDLVVSGLGGVTAWARPRFGIQFGAGYSRACKVAGTPGAFGLQLGIVFGIGER